MIWARPGSSDRHFNLTPLALKTFSGDHPLEVKKTLIPSYNLKDKIKMIELIY